MPEDGTKHFVLPNFTTPVPWTLRVVLHYDIKPRNKFSLNGLGMKKIKYRGVSIMLITGMKVAQCYTVFNHGIPRPHKEINYQGRKIVPHPGMNTAPELLLSGHSKEKVRKEPPHMLLSWIT